MPSIGRLKWMIFSLLDQLTARAQQPLSIAHPPTPPENRPWIWVFCSTIGELNASLSLLRQLEPYYRLALMSDRASYLSAYQRQLPAATLVQLSGLSSDLDTLLRQLPLPELLLLCEIPLLPGDAPCRLHQQLLRGLKKRDIKLAVVNGWLYRQTARCRMDSLEQRWLSRDYLQLFDLISVQTEETAATIRQLGIRSPTLQITGNMKFDQTADTATRTPPSWCDALPHGHWPWIVAGCVSSDQEVGLILGAFQKLRQTHPETNLLLAHRHPEKPQNLRHIEAALADLGLRGLRRSNLDGEGNPEWDVLVLDTFGELRGAFALASTCYMGTNHNLLEPLSLGKPTCIRSGWGSEHPSYPVYQVALSEGWVTITDDATAMAKFWHMQLQSATPPQQILDGIQRHQGATTRNLTLLAALLAMLPVGATVASVPAAN